MYLQGSLINYSIFQ